MKPAENLDKASSIFFFLGFITTQLQHAPILLLSGLSYVGSLFFYTFGYFFWLIACHYYPEIPPQKQHWYGFSDFKNQNRFAAIIGGVGVIFSIIGLFIPVGFVLASWLFLLSNLIWCVSEFHKTKNPPLSDPNYSTSHQEAYLRFAMISTLMCFVPAIVATVIFFFPLIASTMILIGTGISLFLGAHALYAWVDTNCTDHQPDRMNHSYSLLSKTLGEDVQHDLENEIDKDKPMTFPFFTDSFTPLIKIEDNDSSTLSNENTDHLAYSNP